MILKQRFSEIVTLSSPENIIDIISRGSFDIIILDMNFALGATSGKEGLELLRKIIKIDPTAYVLMNTAYGDIELAVQAMKEGAIDFLVKPWTKEKLLATVSAIFELSQSKKELRFIRSKERLLSKDIDQDYPEIISVAESMKPVFSAIEKVATTDANVLILGENGTGKEVVARAIHRKSFRSDEVFIKVDLGAISETLFESELFGHTKGAFTDAKEDRVGRFQIASGGTIFLDEMANLSLPLQAKLLTVLQSRQVTQVGSNNPTEINIRLICATNKPVYDLVSTNKFRQDLLYRINTVEINLPPLRKRIEDIVLLTNYFLDIYKKKYGKPELEVSNGTIKKLERYEWPGNIREFQHAVERAVIMSNDNMLKPADFLFTTQELEKSHTIPSLNVEEIEKTAIINAIKKHGGNLTRATKELGLGRSTLYRKMKKYGLS